jgi:hypothetical protein
MFNIYLFKGGERMLKGQVFAEQTFSSDCFAHFINTFLDKRNGVTKGCILSNTSNSVTVGAGYFVVQGRFLEEVGGTTLDVTSATEYCKLVCEIDLSKINTTTSFLQASWKILKNSSNYPTLTQQDLENGGTIYQLEFAKFQNTTGGITNFVDTRTLIDFESIYAGIQAYITELESNSTVVFKETGKGLYPDTDATKLAGIVTGATKNEMILLSGSVVTPASTGGIPGSGTANINYPEGYTPTNCVVISIGLKINDTRGYNFEGQLNDSVGLLTGGMHHFVQLDPSTIQLNIQNISTSEKTFYYKIVLMKIA